MKKLTVYLVLIALFFGINAVAQNVAITDDNGYTVNPSAMLDVKSTSKGMLIPRVTTAQRNSISNPATGLLVFDVIQGNFYFYNGTSWISLSSTTNSIWTQTGQNIHLANSSNNVGIGTSTPLGKLEVKGDVDVSSDEPLFEVINSNGDTVFAVYSQGVQVRVADDPLIKAGSSKGGFAVGGFSLSKNMTNEYMRITPDSIRMYVEEGSGNKAGSSKGGFAVGGFSISKGTLTNEYLRVSDDSIRVYIDDNPSKGSASKGGFAVGGFSISKTTPQDYFNISGADTAEVIDPSEARMVWYPTKNAFLSGQVLIKHVDSVGENSLAVGYESKAMGDYSQALGNYPRAKGNYSTAIGNYANALADNSFAFGDQAIAKGVGSYAFGSVARNIDTGDPLGLPTTAKGPYSVAFGLGAQADTIGAFAIGNESHAEGLFTTAIGYQSHSLARFSTAMGYQSEASGNFSNAIGYRVKSIGEYSTAIGTYSQAIGGSSFAAGDNCYASGAASTAIGAENYASSSYATAMGLMSTASGYSSFAVGETCTASGQASVAMGQMCQASNFGSFATGIQNSATAAGAASFGTLSNASGIYSLAVGNNANASGPYSCAIGNFTTASATCSHAYGQGIESAGNYSVAWALNNQTGTIVTSPNSFVIMGGVVGIGTISPEAPLDVETDINGYAIHIEEYGVGIEEWQLGVNVNGDLGFFDGATQSITFEDNGNVGIGLTNPAYKLDVVGPANLNSGIATGAALRVNGDEALWYDGTYFSWGFGGTYNYFADDVGIGTTTPDCKLHVKSLAGVDAFRAQVGGATKLVVLGTGGVSVGTNNINAPVNGLYVSGNTGLGRDVTANKLEVNGNASKTTAGSWLANSDKRIKTNILDIENASDLIMKLRPVKFKYTDEWKERNDGIEDFYYYNFIAQEFQEVFPDAVKGSGEYLDGDDNEILQIDTYSAQITGIKAIQEIITENEKQKALIEKQQKQLNELTDQNTELLWENENRKAELTSIKAEIENIKTILHSSAKK